MIDLPLHPFPSPLLPRLRQIKAAMNLDYQVKPRAARYGDKRVLASVTPPFITDYALIRGDSDKDLRDALAWVLEGGDDYRAKGAVDQLSEWLGGKVVEIHG